MLQFSVDWLSGRHWGEPEMSDLESVRRTHDATITAVAGGKLRALADASGLRSPSEGLLDAFAEVFARMSEITMAAASQDEPSLPDESSEVNSEQKDDSESEPKGDDNPSGCLALKQEELVKEEVDLPTAFTPQPDVITESVPQNAGETEGIVLVDSETLVTAPVAAEGATLEVEEVGASEEPERHVLPREDAQNGMNQRRKTKQTDQIKPEVKPLHVVQDVDADATDEVELGLVTEETEEFSEPKADDSTGELRRSRRNRHSGLQQSHQPFTQSGQRYATGNGVVPVNPDVIDAASITEQPQGISPERHAAALTNRIAGGPAVASPVKATTNASRFASAGGSGTREGVLNLPLDTASKAPNRPAADSLVKKGDTTSTLARIKLIQRVSKAFQHLGPDGGVVRLRLAPAEMGSVRVEMRIQQRKVSARVIAETEAASAALREHLPDLRARLESFGMQVEQLDVEMETPGKNAGSPFDDARDERWQEPQQRSRRDSIKRAQPETVVDVSQNVPHGLVSAATAIGIDVHL